MSIKAVIFDLDGVIVSTDEFHYNAWLDIASSEKIYFDRNINDRLRGVSRMESLEIILEKSNKEYTNEEKIRLAEKKNCNYRKLLAKLDRENILVGVTRLLLELKDRRISTAIGSSSKNTRFILSKIGLIDEFNVIVDGNMITKSKPDPEVFLLAASKLGVEPSECIVVEDADAGIEAALSAGMMVLAVGNEGSNNKSVLRVDNLLDLDNFKYIFN